MLEITRQPIVPQMSWRPIIVSGAPRRSAGRQPAAGSRAAEAPSIDRAGRERPHRHVAERGHPHLRSTNRRNRRDRHGPRDRQRSPVVTGRDQAALPSRIDRSAGGRLPDARPRERDGDQTAQRRTDDGPDSDKVLAELRALAPLRVLARRPQRGDDPDDQPPPDSPGRRHRGGNQQAVRHRHDPHERDVRPERQGHPVRRVPRI